MESLPDYILIKTYHKAKQLHLDSKFIELLKFEINRRNLQHRLLSAVK